MLLEKERIMRVNIAGIRREKNRDSAVMSESTDTEQVKLELRDIQNHL